MNIKWTDIGAATKAGRYCVAGRTVLVRPSEIADWIRNPSAVFRTFPVKLFDGSIEHRLCGAEPQAEGRPALARRSGAAKARTPDILTRPV
jgi:hypothetical protein